MADWIDTDGGTVQSTDGRLTLTVPAGAFRARRQVTIVDHSVSPSAQVMRPPVRVLRHFSLSAADDQGRDDTSTFNRPVQLTLQLAPADFERTIAPEVAFYWRDPSRQDWVPVPSVYDRQTMVLTAELTHFSEYTAGLVEGTATIPTIDHFATDLCQGTSSVTISLKVPPGPHGFQPNLILTYSSGGPNGVISESHGTYEQSQGSWVGLGWNLDLGHVLVAHWMSVIERSYLVLNGRSHPLIYLNDSQGHYKTQTDEFIWIKRVNDTDQPADGHWPYYLVRTKEGTEYRFGYEPAYSNPNGINYYTSNGSRMDSYWVSGSDGYGHWLPVRFNLDRITDTHGNQITIQYWAEQATNQQNNGTITYDRWVYPTQILYSSGDAGGPRRKIVFNIRGGRTDLPGASPKQYLNYLLDSIDMFVLVGSTWTMVRKYVFGYAYMNYSPADPNKARDLVLTSLTECDGTATPGTCNGVPSGNTLPPMTFTYTVKNGWVGTTNPVQNCPIALLQKVDNGYGGSIQYAYQVNKYSDVTGVSSQSQWWSVSSKTISDGRGNSYVTSYSHQVGAQAGPYAGWTTKWSTTQTYPMWRGFNLTAEIAPTGHVTEYRFFRGLSWSTNYSVTRSDGQTFGDSECLAGKLYEKRFFESSSGWNNFNGMAQTGSEWNVWAIDSTTSYATSALPSDDKEDWNVYVAFQVAFQKNSGPLSQNAYLYRQFRRDPTNQNGAQYGNLTDIFEYHNAQGGAWTRHIRRWYFPGNDTASFDPNNPSARDHYVVDRMAAENVYAYDGTADGAVKRSTLYCYDNATAWNTPIGGAGSDGSFRGRLTAVRRNASLPSTAQYFDTTYGYDAYGNRTSETRWNSYGSLAAIASSDGRTTSTTYETTYHTFPTTVTNALGQSTNHTYDYVLGTKLSATDPNNAVTRYRYDGFGRVVAVWAPTEDQGQLGAATVLVSYQATRNQPFRIQIGRRKDAGGGLFARRAYEWRFYDGLGRLIQTQADFERSSMVIHAQDVNEVRQGILTDGGSTSVGVVTAGASLIRASDFTGLASAIGNLWTSGGLGNLPGWSSGVAPGGPSNGAGQTPIYGSDIVDLRFWLNAYEIATGRSQTNWTYWPGTLVIVNSYYDGRNLLAAKTVPHLVSQPVPGMFNAYDYQTVQNPQTTYTYDALKRSLTRVQPDGMSTFRWSYSGWSTTTVDENNHQKSATTDALGRLITVQDYLGTGPYSLLNTTTYQYNVADQLTQITDASYVAGLSPGNVTAIVYDSLGRKTDITDPNLGHWHYDYYPIGTLQTQTDAKGNLVQFTYDALDRVLTKNAVTYAYDETTVSYGKGRRTSMTDAAGTASYSYDARGRLTNFSRVINGITYQLATTYDAQDRPLSLSYPNGDRINYRYGDHCKPVDLILNGTTYLVKGATYNALGKPTTLPLGNGLQTTFAYYGLDHQGPVANRWYGLPYQILTGALQQMTVSSYDLVGNPTGLSYGDHVAETLSYTYNELDQLAGVSGAASEGYSYFQTIADVPHDVGNITSKGAAVYTYPASGQSAPNPPYAPTSVSTLGTFTYDNNGNRQTDPAGNTHSYDAENRLTSVSGQVSLQNTYDGDGARLIRVANGTTTHDVGDWYEVDPSTGLATAYYPFNSQAIAMKRDSTLTYLHHDHLGSLVAASNASGGEVASARYWPFGGLRTSSGTLPTDRLFTGQIRDLGDDRFYFFKARYYDATIGKFIQPDSIVPSSKNPQALNRYAYALNNPLRLVDPIGHDAMDPNWVKAFEAAHGGRAPTQQDWEDYQFSLHHPGTGANGAWTNSNWEAYGKVRAILGRELVAQIGKRHPVSFWGAFGTAAWVMNTHRNINTETFVDGPDGVLIVIGGTVPDNADAWTWGDTIIIRQDAVRRYSFSDLKALLAHEYTHVLQYRAKGFGFMPEYLWDARKSVAAGQGVGGPPNELEGQAYDVQHVYETNPWLPGPWDFP